MRIAHVVPIGEGRHSGVLTVIGEVAEAMTALGHEVELWPLDAWSPAATSSLRQRRDRAGIRVVEPAGPVAWYRAPSVIRRLERERRPDVVHLHGSFNPTNTAAAKGLRGPFVVSPHGGLHIASRRRRKPLKAVYGRLFEGPMLRRAALVVALSDVEAEHLRPFRPRRIVVIPNGVTVPDGSSAGHPRAQLVDAQERPVTVVFVGRLDVFHKGLDVLLDALPAAPGVHAVLVGPDDRGERARLAALARERGIADRVRFTGPLDRAGVDLELARADAFVLPSRWEGMPMSLLEALARGRPAVVSPAVESVVPVAAAGAGWVAAPSSLGQCLRSLAGLSPVDWRDAAAAAYRMACANRWPEIARQYEAAYTSVVDVAAR